LFADIKKGCTFTSAKAKKPARKTSHMNLDQKQAAETFFKKVKEIDPAIVGSVDDNLIIRGSYRGKVSQQYQYSFAAQRFLFNNAGRNVSDPFEKVAAELK
jgi:hypothetical protein